METSSGTPPPYDDSRSDQVTLRAVREGHREILGVCSKILDLLQTQISKEKCVPERAQGSASSELEVLSLRTASLSIEKVASITQVEGFVAEGLPLFWPKTLRQRTCFDVEPKRFAHKDRYQNMTGDEQLMSASTGSLFIINPLGTSGLIILLLRILFLTSDVAIIPYIVAWDDHVSLVFPISCLANIFWTVDCLFGFITGVYRNGGLISSRSKTANHYARTWLLPDLVFLAAGWLGLLLYSVCANLDRDDDTWKQFVSARYLWILCLCRFIRVDGPMSELVANQLSDYPAARWRIFRLLYGFLLLNHVVACLWFFVGRIGFENSTNMTWITIFVRDHDLLFRDRNDFEQYWVALCWAVSKFTLDDMPLESANSLERGISVAYMLVGYVSGSIIVSIFSAAMVDYNMQREKQIQLMRTLRQFLVDNPVGQYMQVLTQHELVQRLKVRYPLSEKDVPALESIPKQLHDALRIDMAQPHLVRHPLLRWIHMKYDSTLQGLGLGTCIIVLKAQDVLFSGGSKAEACYFTINGEMEYFERAPFSPKDYSCVEEVQSPAIVVEAALWSEWIHVGVATSITMSQVVRVDADITSQALASVPDVNKVVNEYATQFCQRLKAAQPPFSDWPNDVTVPFTEYFDIVSSLSEENRMSIGLVALTKYMPEHKDKMGRINSNRAKSKDEQYSSETMMALEMEIIKGVSMMMVDGRGIPQRIVSVVAVVIENPRSFVLAEIAKWDGELKISCQKPGAKMSHGEQVVDAVERIVRTKLGFMPSAIACISRTSRNVEEKESLMYHKLLTRYVRTECYLELSDDLEVLMRCVECDAMTSSVAAASIEFIDYKSIFFTTVGSTVVLYAWVDPLGFAFFETQQGKWSLTELLETVDLPSLREERRFVSC